MYSILIPIKATPSPVPAPSTLIGFPTALVSELLT